MDVFRIILVVVLCASKVTATCSPNYIKCGTTNKCVQIRYICDSDNDCGDNTDEAYDLCTFKKTLPTNNCGDREVYCNGACRPLHDYCSCTDIYVDLSFCQMIRDGYLQRLDEVDLITYVDQTTLPDYDDPTTTIPTTTAVSTTPSDLEESQALGEVMQVKLNATVRHESCPPFFTLSNGQCFSFFFLVKLSWAESCAFCQAIGGDLVSPLDETQLRGLVSHLRHLQDSDVKADYWIGGHLRDVSVGWQWLDDTLVPLGTPFWTIRNDPQCWWNETSDDESCYIQAPNDPPVGHCLALTRNKFYYFSDEGCLAKKSPLCVHVRVAEEPHLQEIEEPHLQEIEEPHLQEIEEPHPTEVVELRPTEVVEQHLQKTEELHLKEIEEPHPTDVV